MGTAGLIWGCLYRAILYGLLIGTAFGGFYGAAFGMPTYWFKTCSRRLAPRGKVCPRSHHLGHIRLHADADDTPGLVADGEVRSRMAREGGLRNVTRSAPTFEPVPRGRLQVRRFAAVASLSGRILAALTPWPSLLPYSPTFGKFLLPRTSDPRHSRKLALGPSER